MTQYWCIIQHGYTLFGVGKTKVETVKDANKWLDNQNKIKLKDVDKPWSGVAGELYLLPCTSGLYKSIKGDGSPDDYTVLYSGGTIYVDIPKERRRNKHIVKKRSTEKNTKRKWYPEIERITCQHCRSNECRWKNDKDPEYVICQHGVIWQKRWI